MTTMWDEGESGSAYANTTEVELSENFTCVARYIQGHVELPYSSTFSAAVRGVQAFFYLTLSIAGVFLNTAVIILVAKYKQLRTHSIVIALQVVVLDLMLSVLYLLSVSNAIANKWLLGEFMCAVTGIFVFTTVLVRTFLMFIFVMDRYLTIFWTMYYPKHKVKVILCLSIASWLISLLLRIPFLPGILDCYSFSTLSWLCSINSGCHEICSIYSNTIIVVVVVPLTLLPVVLYLRLYCRGRRIRRLVPEESDHFQREWKATVTFFVLFLSVFIVTLPSIIIGITTRSLFPDGESPPGVHVLMVASVSVLSLLVITDPIVIIRNKDVRDILIRVKSNAVQKRRLSNFTLSSKASISE